MRLAFIPGPVGLRAPLQRLRRARLSGRRSLTGASAPRRPVAHLRRGAPRASAVPAGASRVAAGAGGPAGAPAGLSAAGRVREALIGLFPAWAVLASVAAVLYPGLFAGIGARTVRLALALLMLSTGLTLTGAELRGAARRPLPVLGALAGCFVGMPVLALALAGAFGLPPPLRAGLLLVGIVSGGQMSNLCANIARGDVALSVAMTTASTLAAAPLLPFLSRVLLGAEVPVNPLALAASTAQIVLLPVLLGAALSGAARPIRPVLPLVGMALVLVLILGPVASTATLFGDAFAALALPVALLHFGGGFAGYVMAKLFGAREPVARTMAFEVGFKSPALSFVLATAHFADPAIALPSAVSIIVLAPLAALCAVIFRLIPVKDGADVSTKSAVIEARSESVRAKVIERGPVVSVAQSASSAPVSAPKPASVPKAAPVSLSAPIPVPAPVPEAAPVSLPAPIPVPAPVSEAAPKSMSPPIPVPAPVPAPAPAPAPEFVPWPPAIPAPQAESKTAPGEEPTPSTRFRVRTMEGSSSIVTFASLAAEMKKLRRKGQRIDSVEQI